ncbi:hypothetical protein MLD52_22445 [Puniceicoccaceae bacterium K14]|nr:hypothetical protein [Puniceicoccaceae bacterium K14]
MIPLLRKRLLKSFVSFVRSDGDDGFRDVEFFESIILFDTAKDTCVKLRNLCEIDKGVTLVTARSGYGKTWLLKYIYMKGSGFSFFIKAKECTKGVEFAIARKIEGIENDLGLLKTLIYTNTVKILIDGVNEASPEALVRISDFCETFGKSSIVLTSQPFEWKDRPNFSRQIFIEGMSTDLAVEFLVSRYAFFGSKSCLTQSEYKKACCQLLRDETMRGKFGDDWKRLLNVFDLSLIGSLLSEEISPASSNLVRQQLELVEHDFRNTNEGRLFNFWKLGSNVLKMRMEGNDEIDSSQFGAELLCMEEHRIVYRRTLQIAGNQENWYFRHQRYSDYLIASFMATCDENELMGWFTESRLYGAICNLVWLLEEADLVNLRNRIIEFSTKSGDFELLKSFEESRLMLYS